MRMFSGRLHRHLMPLKVGAIEPHAVKDNGELAGHRNAGAFDAAVFGFGESHSFSRAGRLSRPNTRVADSYSRWRTMASPYLLMRPLRSVSPD
jgi:hypothetical protein